MRTTNPARCREEPEADLADRPGCLEAECTRGRATFASLPVFQTCCMKSGALHEIRHPAERVFNNCQTGQVCRLNDH